MDYPIRMKSRILRGVFENRYIWSKIQICVKNQSASQKSIFFVTNQYFCKESKCLSKIQICVKNQNVSQKLSFLSKIKFMAKIKFLSKINISVKNQNFYQKPKCLSKNFLSFKMLFVISRKYSNCQVLLFEQNGDNIFWIILSG